MNPREIPGWPADVGGWITIRGKVVVLSQIVVPKEQRGAGLGRRAMVALTKWADTKGYTLALSPSEHWGSSKRRLAAFYKGYGFVSNRGRSRDLAISETMVRAPQLDVGHALGLPPQGEWATIVDDPLERGDEGAEDWTPREYTVTRDDEGWVDPRLLLGIPGRKREDELLTFPPGRYDEAGWREMVEWVRSGKMKYGPLIVKERSGKVFVYEGNHRLRAAVAAGLPLVQVNIRYFAGSQRGGQLVIDPKTGQKGPGWVGSVATARAEEQRLRTWGKAHGFEGLTPAGRTPSLLLAAIAGFLLARRTKAGA
jgi:hypothetical protein